MANKNKELSKKIKNNKKEWSKEIKEYHYKKDKSLRKRYDTKQDQHFLQDIRYHLVYLAEAISLSSFSLFEDYIKWVKIFLKNANIPLQGLKSNFKYMKELLKKKLNKEEFDIISKYLDRGMKVIDEKIEKPESYLKKENPHYSLAKDYFDSLLTSDRKKSSKIIIDAVEKGTAIKDIYLNVFQPVEREIGRLWQLNKVSVAKEHYSTSVTQLIMSQLYSYILTGEKNDYKAITTCVGDELHELGIRMIADLLEMEGWDTIHLGANMPAESVVEELINKNGDLLAISVTITSNLGKAADLIKKVRDTSKTKDIKIMVGGYPFNRNKNLWKEIGADDFAPDLNKAVETANNLVKRGGINS